MELMKLELELAMNQEVPREVSASIRVLAAEASPMPSVATDALVRVIDFARGYFEQRGLNHMDAEDLALETGLRWRAHVEKGPPPGLGWLRQVQHHLLVDHFRRGAQEQRLLDAYARERRVAADEHPPADHRSADLLKDLPPVDRDLLHRHYLEETTIEELARGLKLTVNCVKQRLHRARRRLQARLASAGATARERPQNRPSEPQRSRPKKDFSNFA